jgi:hypothetical protein
MMDRAFVRTLALWLALWPAAASATVNELVPPTSGIYTGVQFSQKIGDAFRSLASCNKGPTAPANVGGASVDGLCWIDDSVTPWIKKRYVNGGWAVEGALDPSDSSFAGVIGGGIATIAAGATVDLGSLPQANVLISGAATITSLGATAATGIEKTIRFDNSCDLIPSNALLVPAGYPLRTAAGDRAKVTHLGSGNWEITQFTRANGIPIDLSAVGKPAFTFAVSVPPLHVAGYGQALSRAAYPAYFAQVTRTQNGTRTAGSATVTGIADTSGFGPGMYVEGTGLVSCVIVSVVANSSITLNSPGCATSSGTSPVTVLPYGMGAGGVAGTSIGVPDCRARVMAGRDNQNPGSYASLMSSVYFGADPSVYGAIGGAESVPMAAGNLIAHTHANTLSLTDPGHSHTYTTFDAVGVGAAGVSAYTAMSVNNAGLGSSGFTTSSTGTGITVGITNASAGSGSPTPMRTVQPTLIAECVVRVTP